MQLKDLMQLFREGKNEGRKRGYVSQGACDAEGIAAVVRALRDEMMREFERCDSCSGIEHVEPFFDEILGDAGDEVAGVSVGNGETELDRTSGPAPATDPAPAVCVWTDVGDAYRSACGRSHFAWTSRDGVVVCPHCKAHIKFTEAKP